MLLIAMLEVISTITARLILCKTKVMLKVGLTDTKGKVMKEMTKVMMPVTKAMMTLTNDVRLVFL